MDDNASTWSFRTGPKGYSHGWIKAANWSDGKDYTTGYRRSMLGQPGDFHAHVQERSGKNFDWHVNRQRTAREGPDDRGSWWTASHASGTEKDFNKAKAAATKALKEHRAAHIANGGDVGFDDGSSARAAGMVTNPSGTERLHQYWVHGEGAAKIRWGQPGDFDRCVLHLSKYIADAKGYCNLAHHAALGIYPATHAAMEKHATGRAVMTDTQRAELASASINNLPDSAFAYIEPGGKKDSSGKTTPRSLRHFPVHDEAHARNALARAPQSPFGDKAMPKIRAACKKFGIEISADSSSSRAGEGQAASLAPYFRSVPLEDISIRSGSGRDVEAYAAVFGVSAPVSDQDGTYTEELDPAVFNRAISDAAPQGSRKDWRVGVFYHHGMTLYGAPSDRHSMPIGKTLDMKADSRGLWTLTRYNRTQLADEVLENIREGSITGYSFSGNFRRSDPLIPRGGFRRNYRTGGIPHVRRLESTLREYGPTPNPVYDEAGVTGMRAEQLLGAMAADPELAMRMISMFSDSAPPDSLPDTGAPEHSGLATGDSPPGRSGRSVQEVMQAQRSAFLQRHRR